MKLIKNYEALKSYDCPICKNKKGEYVEVDGYVKYRECECVCYGHIAKRIEKSNAVGFIDRITFENFKTDESWQKTLKENAIKYTKELLSGGNNWFFIGGQVGSGKTHLAISIFRELIYRNKHIRMVPWRNMAREIKANIFDDEYGEIFDSYSEMPILYIDDFFKGNITDGDKNIAYDIINSRYINDLPTIITSEKSIEEIESIDGAIGGRIKEKTSTYCYKISADRNKNRRLK